MNPMAFMWEYFFSDDTNYYFEMGAFRDKSHFGTSADTNRTVFIGVDFDWYCLVGGGFKIGVNIEV